MDRSRNRTDRQYPSERAVAPIIGVTLLIGITVILAAVVGAVVLGLGVGPADAPRATLSFDVVGDEVVVIHEGGAELSTEEIVIRDTDGTEYELDSDLVTGEQTTVVDAGGDPLDLNTTDVDRLTVVWRGADDEQVLATFRP
ncbi:type IV pilin N-terminal domain-containing protein [Halobellus ordinarius]|uniref:type IV pilin N-terminal domain-containing protein n=1 Tax=Halobellus ordinarius TaxID=3075120 RepID=UPI00288009BE|nr:type IV pilin N-terminal domain-containing protein [Halobellus sp. ZY16]